MSLPQLSAALVPLRRDETLTAALAICLLIGCMAEGLSVPESGGVLLLTLPLVWRTRRPLEVLVLITGAVVIYLALVSTTPVVLPPLFVALYTVAAYGTRGRTIVVALMFVPVALLLSQLVLSEGQDVPALLAQMSQFGLTLALGEAVRTHRALIGALRERAERAEHDRELETRRRLNEERVRIARDVHDIVAHSIATISTQASVAVHVGRDEPARAVEALETIKSISAQALKDLRHALGTLREGAFGGPTDPAPSLGHLPGLIQQARESGMSVTFEQDGETERLPAAVEVGLYRIVQEALTNVMRHAGGAAATVHLTMAEDAVEVVVTDDGRGSPTAASAAGTGSGLAGMRERTLALGGALQAGPTPQHGFSVRAVLPLGREAV